MVVHTQNTGDVECNHKNDWDDFHHGGCCTSDFLKEISEDGHLLLRDCNLLKSSKFSLTSSDVADKTF